MSTSSSTASLLRIGLCISVLSSACGGNSAPTSRFPGSASGCAVEATGASVVAARCIETSTARILSLRTDSAGNVIVAGTFRGQLAIGAPTPPIVSTNPMGQVFVAKLAGADLSPQLVRPIDAPGTVRGIASSPAGIGVVTSSPDAPEGPFLTRLDGAGNVALRRDLGFGGLVSGVASDANGAIALRVQQDGLRLVVASQEGNVLLSPRLSPSWIAQFPSSVTADALVPDVAFGPGGAYLVHHRGPSEDGVVSDQALTKVGADGSIVWSRPVPVGANAQIVAMGGGQLAVLTPRAGAICPGPMDRSFAVTALDGEASVRWVRCFSARAADLHLAVDASGHTAIAGSMRDAADLGDGVMRRAPADGIVSFVVRLGDRGESQKVVILGGPKIVGIHGLAAEPRNGGGVVVAGVAASNVSTQTHVFVATLR